MIKLSTGDQVAPQQLENIFLQSEYVEQIWIYGDKDRDYLIAFIVLSEWAARKNFKLKAGVDIDEATLNEQKHK